MLQKDFDAWNESKKHINMMRVDFSRVIFKEREIWWCYLGINLGHEQDGKGNRFMRPVLILKKFSKESFIGIPLTGHLANLKYVIACQCEDSIVRYVIISQIRFFDAKRLYKSLATAEYSSFREVRKAVRDLL
jgi:mRNA interferase MazF